MVCTACGKIISTVCQLLAKKFWGGGGGGGVGGGGGSREQVMKREKSPSPSPLLFFFFGVLWPCFLLSTAFLFLVLVLLFSLFFRFNEKISFLSGLMSIISLSSVSGAFLFAVLGFRAFFGASTHVDSKPCLMHLE